MQLKLTTWNINSVRLRIELVKRFLQQSKTDILCLQETKCPDDCFPLKGFIEAGYPYTAHLGQKGYNGVAIVSRFPFSEVSHLKLGGENHARHISVVLGEEAQKAAGFVIHNFYVPAGGDVPDPGENPKFAHKLRYVKEMEEWSLTEKIFEKRAILVGDLNIAPLEHDVWSHKQLLNVVSHTPVETQLLESFRSKAQWVDALRVLKPEPEKLYTWWSYRSPDWARADKGRRLDHIWVTPPLQNTLQSFSVFKEARSWEKTSDHAPVTMDFNLF